MRDKQRITREQTRKEREFGPYWYSALWKLVRPFLVWTCAGLLALGILTSAWRSVRHRYFDAADAGNREAVSFTVTSGASLSRVAGDLEKAGLIANHSVFRYYADLLGYSQKIQAGEYTLNRSMDIPEHLEFIQTEDIPRLAKSASKEANPLYPVPKILNAKELETLYKIVKGTKM